ncbi:hypothetical protein [Aquirhabdus sp.]|uniref:hypothetical protein n=1 Tax=Aquirhabdus sp. TaxID=2824160 RepID=UPI00396C8272
MLFQLNKASICGVLLSICSVHALADDSDSQGTSIGNAVGSLLGNLIHQAITPSSTNSASSTQALAQSIPAPANTTVPMTAEDQGYFAKGLWHDPSTGLIWSLCRVGENWNGKSCVGTPKQFDWPHAMLAAKDERLGGYNDWRVPTLREYGGILSCLNGIDSMSYGNQYYELVNDTQSLIIHNCNYDQDQEIPSHMLPDNFSYETTNGGGFNEWSSSYTLNLNGLKTQYFPKAYRQDSDSPTSLLKIRLVRGGATGNTYPQVLQFANYVLKLPELRAKAAQTQQENLARRTALFRQNVREGDRAAQGLVIEIKGNLVKLQTYKNVCTMMSHSSSPFCISFRTEVANEEWINRNQLTLP